MIRNRLQKALRSKTKINARILKFVSAFIYRLFREDIYVDVFTSQIPVYKACEWVRRSNCVCSDDWGELFMNQSVNKYR